MLTRKEILKSYSDTVQGIKDAGLFKGELPYVSPQGSYVTMEDGRKLLCMCANNYMGLGDSERLIKAAKRTYDEKGYGVASVRFICGTQDIHKILERKISAFLQTDDTILYSSCFDANGGLFETLLTAEDAVISDELNHASIIDGVRLCKAKRYRYKNNDMEDLEAKLQEADEAGARIKLIATDGVFSMDGIICNLKGICDLADKYEALVMVDDSHAVGFVGAHGRGTQEYCDVMGRVDVITGTLGKALGGASGGYTSGRQEIIDLLRQRSRPYLFSNSLAPAIAGASIEMFNMLEESTSLRDHLEEV
ncbi:MAG: glycine C-acetyltransferase, partial [Erysipelotrichaceae bacterium]|nr:glycine C-acetyltransferase [Erysipelotrichaceae bacterium]